MYNRVGICPSCKHLLFWTYMHVYIQIYIDCTLLAIHHSGIGPTQANNFLTTLNHLFVSSFFFKKEVKKWVTLSRK